MKADGDSAKTCKYYMCHKEAKGDLFLVLSWISTPRWRGKNLEI